MNPEKQRIAIAKYMGAKLCPIHLAYECCGKRLPDYLNDLNAMNEAEGGVFNKKQWHTYTDLLIEIQPKDQSPIRSTAAQRAEALLRTLNLWTEE